jgi:peptidoglycan/LPS O-acetylase OafA/YrhL
VECCARSIAGSVDPLWSISVEEQFYIVIPVLAAFAGRRAVAIVSYLHLALAYVTVLLYALHPTSGDNGEWTNSFVQFQFFSAGTLIGRYPGGTRPLDLFWSAVGRPRCP